MTINVVDPNSALNKPFANTDYANTEINKPVTLYTLSNDQSGNIGINLDTTSVRLMTPPVHGTVVLDSATGNFIYTPKAGFAGVDTLFYRVCDTNSPSKCDTAMQIITVVSPNTPNTTEAADDYVSTTAGKPVSGTVLTNDKDPEGCRYWRLCQPVPYT